MVSFESCDLLRIIAWHFIDTTFQLFEESTEKEPACHRLNLSRLYVNLYQGKNFPSLREYLLSACYPEDLVEAYMQTAGEAEDTVPAQRLMEEIVSYYLTDTVAFLDLVLSEPLESPESSAIMAYHTLDLARQLQNLLFATSFSSVREYLRMLGRPKREITLLKRKCDREAQYYQGDLAYMYPANGMDLIE